MRMHVLDSQGKRKRTESLIPHGGSVDFKNVIICCFLVLFHYFTVFKEDFTVFKEEKQMLQLWINLNIMLGASQKLK